MKPSVSTTTYTIPKLVCGLLLVGWTLGAVAQEQASPMLDYVDDKMIGIGAQMQNAKMRLSRDFAGVDPNAPEDAQTVVVQCCMANLETISDKLVELREAMALMLEFYRGQHNNTAVAIMGEMNARLDQTTAGMVHFARSANEARAFDALNGLIRPWNEFRNGVRALRGCCPLPISIPEETPVDDGQTRKKDKKREQASKKTKD